jgi:hypothetical protein
MQIELIITRFGVALKNIGNSVGLSAQDRQHLIDLTNDLAAFEQAYATEKATVEERFANLEARVGEFDGRLSADEVKQAQLAEREGAIEQGLGELADAAETALPAAVGDELPPVIEPAPTSDPEAPAPAEGDPNAPAPTEAPPASEEPAPTETPAPEGGEPEAETSGGGSSESQTEASTDSATGESGEQAGGDATEGGTLVESQEGADAPASETVATEVGASSQDGGAGDSGIG